MTMRNVTIAATIILLSIFGSTAVCATEVSFGAPPTEEGTIGSRGGGGTRAIGEDFGFDAPPTEEGTIGSRQGGGTR